MEILGEDLGQENLIGIIINMCDWVRPNLTSMFHFLSALLFA